MRLFKQLCIQAMKISRGANYPLTMERSRLSSILTLQKEVLSKISRQDTGDSFESLVQYSGIGKSHLFQSDPPTCGNTVQS